MPKAYSGDLRKRVIETVAAGASRREAAELFMVAASTPVKWLRRLRDTGNSSPLEQHAALILGMVKEWPARIGS
jgi:transposase